MNKFNYTNLTPFKWFVLENFPFIEADFDALTEWQLFCKLGKEINKIIDSQNIVGEETQKLNEAYIALENYVNNYFDNLDVQEEINNKLNEMAESGELTALVLQYINVMQAFNTVADMKTSDVLKNGSIVKTLGFYSIEDGGGALYRITNNAVANEMNIIALNNNLFAQLIIDSKVNVKQFGAKGDGINDDTISIQTALNIVKHSYYDKGGIEIIIPIPSKFYKITDTLDFTELWNIKIYCPTAYGNQRQNTVVIDENYKLFHWYGTNDKAMILLDYTFSSQFENITLNGRNIAKYGFKISPENQVSGNKYVTLRRCSALYCYIGISVGDTINQTDDCPISLYDCYFEKNTLKGLEIKSGNDCVKMFGGLISENGQNLDNIYACNTHVISGEVSLIGVTSDGEPYIADIIQEGGGLTLIDYWSDIGKGKLYLGKTNVTRINMTSVRHYDGSMTRDNTPTSIEYNGKATLVLSSCSFFGDVTINNGAVPKVVDIGTEFLNSNAGFNGTAIEEFNALVSIGSGNNNYGNFSNGLNRSNLRAQQEINGRNLVTCELKSVEDFVVNTVLNKNDNSERKLINCKYDTSTNTLKSIKAGFCMEIFSSVGGLNLRYANASTADESLTLIPLCKIEKTTAGSANGRPSVLIGNSRLMFDSNIPNGGSWRAGDIIINQNFNGNNNFCWIYTTANTWVEK